MRFVARLLALMTLAAWVVAAGPASAQLRDETVVFPEGSSDVAIDGRLQGREIVTYTVTAVPGRKLAVGLQTDNAANHFNLSAPEADEALFVGSSAGNYAETVMTKAGDYRITVYLMSSAARRNEHADYLLSVSLLPAGDYADGLSGGPDYWQVAGVNSRLRLRGGPSSEHAVVGGLDDGQVVRNLGCRMTGDERWCRVESLRGGDQGWVAGGFLREAAAPQAAGGQGPEGAGQEDGGQRFDATGRLPCSPVPGQPTTSCGFGVIREARPGDAGLWIDIGGTAERYFRFEEGKPVRSNGAGEITVERLGNLNLLRLGGERYEILDTVIYGG